MAEQQNGKKKKGSLFPGVVVVLFAVFALTSGMLGFVLGKNASRSTGELVDTIVLSPGDSSSRAQPVLHFLTGRLRDKDGSPCEGVTVSLGDGDRSDVTDSAGKFYLSDVRSGVQTFSMTDETGTLLASAQLSLDFSKEDGVSASTDGDILVFQMPEDARLLEFTVTEQDGGLTVGDAYFVTAAGGVVDFEGACLPAGSGAVVTPCGNVAVSDGYVVLPSQAVTLTPLGSQVPLSPGEEAAPGLTLEEDGSLTDEEGVTLLPDGQVSLPDGETVGGGDHVVLVQNGGAQELVKLPEPYVPSNQTSQPAGAADSPNNGENGEQEDDPGPEENNSPKETVQAEAGPTPTPTPKPTPEPMGEGLDVRDSITGLTWRQQSMVDLFKNRTTRLTAAMTENGIPVAAPGDQGYYDFRLQNPENYDISYTIAIEEKSFHLPILYSVVDTADNRHYLFSERTAIGEALVSPPILIKAGTVQNFRIEWEWQYEDWEDMERDDALDTTAGTAQDRTYLVSVSISAEQVVYPATGTPGGDIRYPGKR